MSDAFDIDRLEAAAREATGLEDFGDDGWREPFARLVDAIRAEAGLSPGGTQIMALQFHDRLVNRLEIQDHLRRHPEIHDEDLGAPLVLATLPRTGQTAAGWILDRDPANRSLLRWFAKRPCPPPTSLRDEADPRMAQERALISAMPPELLEMHLSAADEPDECHWLLSNDFRIPHEIYAMRVPGYYRWVRDDPGMAATYRYYATQLRLLQSRLPPARWVLKNSPHLLHLDALHEVMPQAVFVQFHRDPLKVLASNCKLSLLLRRMYRDDVDPTEVGDHMLGLLGDYLERLLQFRASGVSRPWIDIRFREFVADPLAAIEEIYDRAGFPLEPAARQAMAKWVTGHPRRDLQQARPADLEPYGIHPDRAREAFADYLDTFDVDLDGI